MHSIICQIYLNEAEGQKKLGSGSIYQVSQRGERSKMSGRDFPAGPVVENLPANAGGHRFDPWSRKIPHATGQLSPCPTPTEPTCHQLLKSTCPRTCEKVKVKSLSQVQLFGTPWTIAYQAPPSLGFSRQEYWSGLPFPSPRDLPNPGIQPGPPALWTDTLAS